MKKYFAIPSPRLLFCYDDSLDTITVLQAGSTDMTYAGALKESDLSDGEQAEFRDYFSCNHGFASQEKWNVDATTDANSKLLTLSISRKLMEGLDTKPIKLNLFSKSSEISWFDWTVDIVHENEKLASENVKLSDQVDKRELEMSEMVEAVEGQREEYVNRVCAIIEERSRIVTIDEIATAPIPDGLSLTSDTRLVIKQEESVTMSNDPTKNRTNDHEYDDDSATDATTDSTRSLDMDTDTEAGTESD